MSIRTDLQNQLAQAEALVASLKAQIAALPPDPPPVIMPPPSPVLLSEVLLSDFAPMAPEVGDAAISITSRYENSQGWEAMSFHEIHPVAFSMVNGNLQTVMRDSGGAYSHLLFCKDVGVDFRGKVLHIVQKATLHTTPDRRSGISYYITPNGDDDVTFPAVWSGTFAGANPFHLGEGLTFNCGSKAWSAWHFIAKKLAQNSMPPNPALGYDPFRAYYAQVFNSDTAPFEYRENQTDAAALEMHLYELYLSETELRIYETWSGASRLKVRMIFIAPLPWTKPAIMWGPWIYHLDIDASYLLHCQAANPKFGDVSWFVKQHPLDDLRQYGAIKYELLDTMPAI